jgi:hypothetical protein
MPILTIRHVTAYHYQQPVAEHRIMLRPRATRTKRYSNPSSKSRQLLVGSTARVATNGASGR